MTATETLADRKVLVIEDEVMVSMMIEDMLADLGAEVVGPASSLDQALALADQAVVDVALLDVNLNGDLSYPVAQRLVERCVPFVLATGYGSSSLADAPEHAAVLKKPFAQAELVSALSQALRSRIERQV